MLDSSNWTSEITATRSRWYSHSPGRSNRLSSGTSQVLSPAKNLSRASAARNDFNVVRSSFMKSVDVGPGRKIAKSLPREKSVKGSRPVEPIPRRGLSPDVEEIFV